MLHLFFHLNPLVKYVQQEFNDFLFKIEYILLNECYNICEIIHNLYWRNQHESLHL